MRIYEWGQASIGDLTTFITSGSRGWAQYYSEAGYKFLRIQNVGRNRLITDDLAFVNPPDTAEARRTQVQPGDVLLSITADLGRTAVVPNDLGRTYINQHLAILRFEGVDPSFVSAYLASPAGQEQIITRNRQGVKAGLNFDDIRSLSIPIPPLPEQRRIAAILDQADALRAKRREAIDKLGALTRSIFIELFGDPASNPKSLATSALADVIIEGPQNGLYKPASAYGEGTPILRIDAFYDGKVTNLANLKRLQISPEELMTYGLQENDIVINRVNSIEYLGKSAIIPSLMEAVVFESNMMRFRLDDSQVHPVYLVELLQTPFIKTQIKNKSKDAVNQSSINQQDVKSFRIRVPPLALQHEFANQVAAIDRLKAVHQASLAKLDELFASLQHRAFRGELTTGMVEPGLAEGQALAAGTAL